MKKSQGIRASLLAAASAMVTGCGGGTPPIHVHLNASGQCISDPGGIPVEQRICYGSGGGYYGGRHYVYVSSESAPYYRTPGSPGYVRPWGGGVSSPASVSSGSGTVRGFFGGSAHGGGE